MNKNQKISLCLTTYNREDMLLESFEQVLKDPRIQEIVIMDDCSKVEIFNSVQKRVLKHDKIALIRNIKNIGMSRNKKDAIRVSETDFCIIFDSDNKIDSTYIDALYQLPKWSTNTIYMPAFARPQFDYRSFIGHVIDRSNVKEYIDAPMGDCLFNTCNYFVPRDRYVKTYRYNPEMIASDTVYFNYLWLKSGGKFQVVEGMEYFHRVHEGSGFLEQAEYNMKKAQDVKAMIKAL